MKVKIIELLKFLVYKYTSFGDASYSYNLEPSQLAKIINILDLKLSSGEEFNLMEIGLARGMTTRFICEHLSLNNFKGKYYCIDTFSSFVQSDLEHEILKRGKKPKDLRGFNYINFKKWKKTFEDFSFIQPIQADISKLDFSDFKNIGFCLSDVDLYKPTKYILENFRKASSQEAYLMVDDVRDEGPWDGSFQAYKEFTNNSDVSHEIVGSKSGLIKFSKN